ncbi:MAG: response regulator transcription factor [Burkholderia sp.]
MNTTPLAARAGAYRPRILLVEDDLALGREIAAALEDHGFAVEIATTGQRGMRRGIDERFDAIVLDRMLPDIDGMSVLATLRNLGRDMPVLILSALAGVDERVRGLRGGGDDYVTKPVDELELSARLNALLRRHRSPEHETVLSFADLALDLRTRSVTRAGQAIELKPREFALLETLMRQSGQVVTRAMLFEAVWNYHFSAQSSVIDIHMGHLRRKINLNGALGPLIHTVRNVGYILQAMP